MFNKNKQAFTLVELIVVITILAILGTIAFISLQGYSAQARDSRRVSDISNIKTSLELFQLNTGKYPLPDDGGEVLYSGELLWTQGVVGDNVTSNLYKNLPKKPTDPLHGIEYVYSTTNIRKEYELLAVYEGDLTNVGMGNNVYAANVYKPRISGNYNSLYVRTTNFIVPTPSIITSEDLPLDLNINRGAINSMVVSGGTNLPNLNIAGAEVQTGGLDINLSVYEGSISSKSTDTEKENAIAAIRGAYSGTTLAGEGVYLNVLSDKGALELANEIFLNKTTSTSSNVSGNNLISLSFDSNNWIQENSIVGTIISNGKLQLLNTGGSRENVVWSQEYSSYYDYSDDFKTITPSPTNVWNSEWTNVQFLPTDGKLYFELTTGGSTEIGFSNTYYSEILTTGPGAYYLSSNPEDNSVVGMALDTSTSQITMYRNGSLDTGLGGWGPYISFPSGGAKLIVSTFNREVELNSGQKPFVYDPPVGYSGYNTILYPVTQAYYLTTTNSNSIDLSGKSKIDSVSIANNQPTNTSIKALISFDGKNTWKKWNGSYWINHSGGLGDLQSGNTIGEIETGLSNFSITSEVSIDFAFDLSTTDSGVTPEITGININTSIEQNVGNSGGGNDEYTVLLLQSETSDGSTIFSDSSIGKTEEHIVSAYGQLQHSTTYSKFGNSSIAFDGSGDYLIIPDSVDWTFGNGDFTIDFWLRNNTGVRQMVFNQGTGSNHDGVVQSVALDLNGETQPIFTYKTTIAARSDNRPNPTTYGINIFNGDWHHYTYERKGNFMTFYIDGVLLVNNNISTAAIADSAYDLLIGAYSHSNYNLANINGNIEELRISKGIARTNDSTDQLYITNTCENVGDTCFLVPSLPYSN